MKRKKRIYLGAAMLIVTMTLSYMACQKPTEPNPTAIPVTWKVYVLDEVGNAIPNAAVQLTADSGNAIYSFPVTQQDGSATITPSVPAGYIQYAAAIAAPNYPAQSSQTVTLGCSDTVLVFTLIKPAVVQCGTATTVSDTLHTVCFGSSDSAQTLVTVPCPGTTTVSAAINTPPTTNPNLWSVTYAKVSNGVTSAAIANPSFTLAEGDKVLIKVLYKPTAISTGNDEFNETLTLTSNAAGSTPTPFTYAVIGSSENCTSCDCPPNSYTAQLGTAASPDSACVGVTQDTSFNLAKLKIENNGTCTWKFILQTPNNFGNGSVVSIGSGFNPSFTVSPGQTLDSISILFTPQQNQLYNATAIYQIELISASGTVTTCSQTLTLSFVGQGAAPNCSVDVGKSSILQTSR